MVTNVYLDTQHISRAASGRNNLAQYFRHSEIQFFYSATHIVECLPKEPIENADAIARLQIITGDRSKNLVAWTGVMQTEKKLKACQLGSIICQKRSEMLFPGYSVSRKEWNRKVRDGLKGVLSEKIADQNVRRSWQAKLLKGGKLTPAAFKFLRGELQQTTEKTSKEMPEAVSLLGDGGIYDFLEGRVSEEDFTERFIQSLGNPVSLASLSLMPELDSILTLSKFFWTEMERIAEILSRLVAKLLVEQVQREEFDYRKLRFKIEEFTKTEDFRSAVSWRFCGSELSLAKLDEMPGTRLFVDVFSQYVLETTDRYANRASKDFGVPPKFKRSDIADLTHVFYLPYMHLFGCDGAMRDRIKRAGWSIENVITSDDEFERRLSEVPHLD